ncbi:pyridoxal phosphate-dependent aminotransferase [Marihabitans asiaticum]|uniref:Succinyldiaminopimelate aminotransferase n=1 Tax=Marihabitans asiaticum TaxID=415218 RepID=A0A560W9N5_9MICO|nr:aminotransferase class I/II-fold pyridoxal phosphate-dependent enzyme [Marihabitans asiaticum]TWD14343.1 succinyldiaminopimelate aminotransferase [Marihabitans asiaticum]
MSDLLIPRLRAHGESIFATMSRLAVEHEAINLGQGFPDDPAPPLAVAAAKQALDDGYNQYPPARGVPQLLEEIATHQRQRYDLPVDPATGVTVTTGATGALAGAILGLVEPGDEVVMFAPYYDAYAALVDLAGGVRRSIPLRFPDLTVDAEALAAACGPKTRVIMLNSPHNPMGKVYTPAELEIIAEQARRHDAIVLSDEVYEHMTFDGHEHTPIATLPGMWERTITISSAGKSFSVTGWKVGWASGHPDLVDVVAGTAQWLTFSGGGAMQVAAAEALRNTDAIVTEMNESLLRRRDLLVEGLSAAGLTPRVPEGTYFVVSDTSGIGVDDVDAWCREIPEAKGVAGVPVSAFCDEPGHGQTLVRFAFCKSEERIREGTRRLAR